MEKNLVNSDYIHELMGVADDQDESGLVQQLFERLQVGQDEFFQHVQEWIKTDPAKLAFQLHKLKNQYANLGCERATQLLEDMYQFARQGNMSEVQNLLPRFQDVTGETIQRLRFELSH